jgi:hypothetical protein
MRTFTSLLLLAMALATTACSDGGAIGIPLQTTNSTFRLVGASATTPAGAALPAEQQALADRLLGGRWSTLGLHWSATGEDQLALSPGSFESSQAPATPVQWSHHYPQSDSSTDSIALQGQDAVWTTQFADAGDGFTGLTLEGRIDTLEAADRVQTLLLRRLLHSDVVDREAEPLLIRWNIGGMYQGAPFTAEVEQDYYVESYSYGQS